VEGTWKKNLIQMLVQTTSIRDQVGWRVYPARLASVQDPKFPCINFETEGGAFPYRGAPYSTFSIRFWFYTEESMGAAHKLYALGDAVLRNSIIVGEEMSAVLDPASRPVEISESDLFCETVNYFGRAIHG